MLNIAEAQELHERIGIALQTGDTSVLARSLELAAIVVADAMADGTRPTLTRAQIVDGTGFPRDARFQQVTP